MAFRSKNFSGDIGTLTTNNPARLFKNCFENPPLGQGLASVYQSGEDSFFSNLQSSTRSSTPKMQVASVGDKSRVLGLTLYI